MRSREKSVKFRLFLRENPRSIRRRIAGKYPRILSPWTDSDDDGGRRRRYPSVADRPRTLGGGVLRSDGGAGTIGRSALRPDRLDRGTDRRFIRSVVPFRRRRTRLQSPSSSKCTKSTNNDAKRRRMTPSKVRQVSKIESISYGAYLESSSCCRSCCCCCCCCRCCCRP